MAESPATSSSLSAPLPSEASERRFLAVAAALFLGLALLLLPETYLISDEASYLALATTFLRGHVHPDLARVSIIEAWQDPAGHLVAKHPPGNALFLVPFLLAGGIRAAFLAMPLAHVLGFLLCARLFRALGRDPRLAVLYLLHPTAVLFSRSVMGDVLAATAMLVALSEVALGRASLLAGAGLGALVLVRPQEAIVGIPVFLVAIAQAGATGGRKELVRRAFRLALGGAPFVAILLGYDALTTGSPFVLPYEKVDAGLEHFGLEHVPRNAAFYGLALLAAPPLLGLAWLVDRPRRALVLAPVLVSFVFYCLYDFLDKGSGWLEGPVRGLRFHLPVLPLLLASYAGLLSRFARGERARALLPWVLLPILLACALLLAWKHEERIRERAALRDFLYARTPDGAAIVADDGAAKLHQTLSGGTRQVAEWKTVPDSAREAYVALLEEEGQTEKTIERRWWCGFVLIDSRTFFAEAGSLTKGRYTLRVFRVWR